MVYRMDIVVFYDDCFAKKFKNMSTTRIKAVMAIVEEMFSEYDSLETTIQFKDDFPIVPKFQSNWCDKNWEDIIKPSGELGMIADGTTFPAHAYIFLTHGSQNEYNLGRAHKGQACNPNKSYRISINQYKSNSWMNGDLGTAGVICEHIIQYKSVIALSDKARNLLKGEF